MTKHLKSKQEYIDRYDRITVNDCRWRENFHKNYKGDAKHPSVLVKAINEIPLYYDLLFSTLNWWEKKEQTIQEWMNRDVEKDRLLETAEAPEGIRCLKCQAISTHSDGTLHDRIDDDRMKVLYFYDCPNGCLPGRMFFNDGEEYIIKPDLCSKCQAEVKRTSERTEDKKIVTTSTCPKCGNTETDEFNLNTKEEKPDPDFEKDRIRFCLTGETAMKKLEEKRKAEDMKRLVDSWKEKTDNKELYDAVAKINKLTVFELEKLLVPVLEKQGYIKLQFGNPIMDRDFQLPFTTQESKSDRTDRASTYDLSRLIKKSLADTNWRLMTDGIFYRMGILTGRLRAYEKEEDLLRLVKK